ncbi:MAG: hypothetical protein P4L39_05330 [Humidesulfovibrio sp.]|nr:hypothetical protein [Humidesulfovibrio sp.]
MRSQSNPFMELESNYRPGPDPRRRVGEALGTGGASLHPLDYEDLALTTAGMRLVSRAALTVLRRFSSVEEGGVPLARALALFLDHVFWDAKTGGLILCAEFPERSYCLSIPHGLWGMKTRSGRTQ